LGRIRRGPPEDRDRQDPTLQVAVTESLEAPDYGRPAALKALGIGFVLAALVSAISFPRFVFSYLIILVHELGHALCYWLFGYPAVPAFDFVHGGGITVHQERSILLLLCAWAALAGLIWIYRGNALALKVFGTLAALHVLFVLTGFDAWFGLAGGHLFELLFAAIFLYRAATGSGVKVPLERPLYAACGFFLLFQILAFAGRLVTSASARGDYREAKGGALAMDLDRLANELLGVSLPSVAFLLLLAALSVPLLTWLWVRHEEAVFGFLGRLFDRSGAA
jgi:hypothetical protein